MKKLSIIFFLLGCVTNFNAQENTGIPPEPTVASLVTVEKDSINNTGTIVQKIPITNISIGKYSFPISLVYSSMGVKVEEIPSYVGTGWNLISGGVITRSVLDLPDDIIHNDHGKGILHTDIMDEIYDLELEHSADQLTDAEKKDFFKNEIDESSTSGVRNDTQPDIFYFDIFGVDGKFVFNKDKEIVSLNNDNFIFDYTLDSEDTLDSFTIVDTQGLTYVFSDREYSETEYKGEKAFYAISSRSLRQRHLDYFSSWHLSSIILPNNNTIDFTYEEETLKYTIRGSVMSKICDTGQCEDLGITDVEFKDVLNNTAGSETEYVVQSKKIISITSDFSTVSFSNTSRLDLEGGLKLRSISVKDHLETIVDEFDFYYSYFNSTSTPSSDAYENYRLKLQRISHNNDFSHEFTYYEDHPLPNRKSTEQDFWGYYNNNNSFSLVPEVYVSFNEFPYKYHVFAPQDLSSSYTSFGQIDRNANELYTHMGLLKTIEYKTEGKKTFHYEPNEFTHQEYTDGTNSIKGNGVRLEKIDYYDGTDTRTILYNYNLPNTNVSSGRVSYLPGFGIHIPWEFTFNISAGAVYNITSPLATTSMTYFQTTERDQWGKPFYCYNMGSNQYNYSPTNNPQQYFAMTTRRYSVTQIPLSQNIQNQFTYQNIKVTDNANGSKAYVYDITGALDEPVASDKEVYFQTRTAFTTNYWQTFPAVFQNYSFCAQITGVGRSYKNFIDDYTLYADLSGNSHPFLPKPNWNRNFGLLKSFVYRNESGYKVFELENEYELIGDLNNISNTKKIIGLKYSLFVVPAFFGWSFDSLGGLVGPSTFPAKYIWSFYDVYYGNGLAAKETKKTYYFNNESESIEQTIVNTYKHGNFLDSSEITYADGSIEKNIYKYPLDFSVANNIYKKMVDKNMIYNTIQTINIKNAKNVSSFIESYYQKGVAIYLRKTSQLYKMLSSNYSGISADANGLVIDNSFYDKTIYESDTSGNPLEVSSPNDKVINYVWGYKSQYPVMKIENLPKGTFESSSGIQNIISDIQDASNEDDDRELGLDGKEGELRSELENLKNYLLSQYSNIVITYYTYDPLVGVTSITDQRGNTVYYDYDNFNRLRQVMDIDGNIVLEHSYNYKN